MKNFVKLACLLLAVIMMLPFTAFAAESVEPRASNFFMAHGCYIDIISSKKFEVWFDVTSVETMDQLGVKTITVQRSADGDSWESVATYKKADYPEMIDTNTIAHVGYVTYSEATSGYYYRAKIVFYAKKGSNIGEYTMYTSSVQY